MPVIKVWWTIGGLMQCSSKDITLRLESSGVPLSENWGLTRDPKKRVIYGSLTINTDYKNNRVIYTWDPL